MRQDVVSAARGWIGTPYRRQASCRGAGADCLGLIRGVWREVLGHEPVVPPPYTDDWGEVAREEVLWRAAEGHLVPRPGEVEPGDVLLFRMREGAVAKHLGILVATGAEPRFVHAWSGHGVVENHLSPPWARRVVARFSFPEGAV